MYDHDRPLGPPPIPEAPGESNASAPAASGASHVGRSDVLFPPEPSASVAATSEHEVQAPATSAPLIVTPPPAPVVVQRGSRWWQTLVAAVLGAVLAVGGMQLIDDGDSGTAAAAPAIVVPSADAATDVPVAPDLTPTAPVAEAPMPDVPAPAEIAPAPTSADAVAVGEKVIPSIVTVEVTSNGRVVGSGSGVIITDDGFIVTNDHVAAVGSTYQIVLSDGRTTYSANLVGTDPLTDLAVLDIEATGLTPIDFGSAEALSVGAVAVAVGSPLGLAGGPSLTVGVVSAFGRQVQTSATDILYGMIQTDAPITSGSSGGALVDGAGRLIGITTAVGVSDVGVEGIGFATPVEIVSRIVNELVANGEIGHAFLGISGVTAFDEAVDGAMVASGVEIGSVESGSAAASAGISPGDVITAIDGLSVETMDELIVALRVRFPGDPVQLTVNGVTVTATLGER